VASTALAVPGQQPLKRITAGGDMLGHDAGRSRDRNVGLNEKWLAPFALQQRAGSLALLVAIGKRRGCSGKQTIAQLRRPNDNVRRPCIAQQRRQSGKHCRRGKLPEGWKSKNKSVVAVLLAFSFNSVCRVVHYGYGICRLTYLYLRGPS
jgi:hypothetical protein